MCRNAKENVKKEKRIKERKLDASFLLKDQGNDKSRKPWKKQRN